MYMPINIGLLLRDSNRLCQSICEGGAVHFQRHRNNDKVGVVTVRLEC